MNLLDHSQDLFQSRHARDLRHPEPGPGRGGGLASVCEAALWPGRGLADEAGGHGVV